MKLPLPLWKLKSTLKSVKELITGQLLEKAFAFDEPENPLLDSVELKSGTLPSVGKKKAHAQGRRTAAAAVEKQQQQKESSGS